MKGIFTIYIVIMMVMLAACSSSPSYGPDTAAERGDVVDLHGMITNAERLDTFLANIQNKNKDKVRITQYTVEGDPIYLDFIYNGVTVRYKYDDTQDEYGAGDTKSTVCSGFSKTTVDDTMEYKLIGCSGNNADMGNAFSFKLREDTKRNEMRRVYDVE